MPVDIVIEQAPPHLIAGLLLRNASPIAADFGALDREIEALPGAKSLYVAELTPDGMRPIHELNADTALAIGSSFKLYVLSELAAQVEAGRHRWDEVVRLDSLRSLPSGQTQTWPKDAPVTLQTLATLMISVSDNTATDRLIRLLGRENVERRVATAGNAHAARNRPFLTTREMFALKVPGGDSTTLASYAAADEAGRRRLLAGAVAKRSLDEFSLWPAPLELDRVEWFASARDLGAAMRAIWQQNGRDTTAVPMRILRINPGISNTKGFDYVGFKGGSEPGVLALALLLHEEGANGRWLVVAGEWNDPAAAVDDAKGVGIVERAIRLVRGGG